MADLSEVAEEPEVRDESGLSKDAGKCEPRGGLGTSGSRIIKHIQEENRVDQEKARQDSFAVKININTSQSRNNNALISKKTPNQPIKNIFDKHLQSQSASQPSHRLDLLISLDSSC